MQKLLLCFILAGFLFQSCNSDDKSVKPVAGNDTSSVSKQPLAPMKGTIVVKLDSTGAEIFASFLEKFNKDSLFQISRVQFPFVRKTRGCGEPLKTEKIVESNWKMYSLDYHDSLAKRELDAYKREIKIANGKAKVLFFGVESDFHVEYTFILKDKRWYFVEDFDTSC